MRGPPFVIAYPTDADAGFARPLAVRLQLPQLQQVVYRVLAFAGRGVDEFVHLALPDVRAVDERLASIRRSSATRLRTSRAPSTDTSGPSRTHFAVVGCAHGRADPAREMIVATGVEISQAFADCVARVNTHVAEIVAHAVDPYSAKKQPSSNDDFPLPFSPWMTVTPSVRSRSVSAYGLKFWSRRARSAL